MEERKNEYLETAKFNVDENIYYLVAELSRTKDKMKALNILRDAFSKELGAMTYEPVDDGQPVGSAMSGLSTCPQNNQTEYVRFVNTKDEGFLYPHLELLLREMVEEECWPDRKKRVLSYIDAFMELWKEGRSNQASQEQQKRPQEATNGHTPTITPQEQKTAAEPKDLKDLLPEQLRTDEALKIFQRAIDANLIEKTATGLKWQLGNALLAYLCGIVYCGDTKQWNGYFKEYIVKRGSTFFPDKALSELFGVKNLGQSRLQLKYLPRGYEKVDVLFKG